MNPPDISLRFAENQEEALSAFDLAAEVFVNEKSPSINSHKELIWFDDPEYSENNIFIAIHKNEIVGVIRLVPKTIYCNKLSYKLAGLTSICIKKKMRGYGISALLIDYVLTTAKERGFDFSMVIARRAYDYYYTKFGFYGISSYEKVAIEGKIEVESSIEFRKLDKNYIEYYSAYYNNNYQNCYGRVKRDLSAWIFILDKVSSNSLYNGYSIFKAKKLIGYVLIVESTICEISMDKNESLADVYYQFKNIEPNLNKWMELPSYHTHVQSLNNIDVVTQRRECAYGGHMGIVLNYKLYESNLKKRFNLNELSIVKDTKTHRYMNLLLGTATNSAVDKFKYQLLPFNLSYFDQF